MNDRLLKAKEVMLMIGLSRTTIWRLERDGNFPKRKQITRTKVGWLKKEIQEWIETRPTVGAESI